MKRWRTVLWALLLVLPGGLWVLGAVALVNALRRPRTRWATAPVLPPAPPADDATPALHPRDAATSTWF